MTNICIWYPTYNYYYVETYSRRKCIILKASFISAWGADLLQVEVSFTVLDAIWLCRFLCEASENIDIIITANKHLNCQTSFSDEYFHLHSLIRLQATT